MDILNPMFRDLQEVVGKECVWRFGSGSWWPRGPCILAENDETPPLMKMRYRATPSEPSFSSRYLEAALLGKDVPEAHFPYSLIHILLMVVFSKPCVVRGALRDPSGNILATTESHSSTNMKVVTVTTDSTTCPMEMGCFPNGKARNALVLTDEGGEILSFGLGRPYMTIDRYVENMDALVAIAWRFAASWRAF